MKFVASHIHSHSDTLKMQMSWGSYLSSFSVCTEQVDFDNPNLWKWSMDDLILKVVVWQNDNWVNWSALLMVEQSSKQLKGVAKVVLQS